MTNLSTATVNGYTYALDPMTGEGALVLPLAAHDVAWPAPDGGGLSMHEDAFTGVMRTLDRMGWEPSDDEAGGLLAVGTTADGRAIIGLYGREPIADMPSAEQVAEAWQDIARAVGLVGLVAGDAA